MDKQKHKQGPTVVHCYGGKGRTGTMLAILINLRNYLDSNDNKLQIDITRVISLIRYDRAFLVQTVVCRDSVCWMCVHAFAVVCARVYTHCNILSMQHTTCILLLPLFAACLCIVICTVFCDVNGNESMHASVLHKQ